jgi:hypothetical protein
MSAMKQKIVGPIEVVDFPEFGLEKIDAKIDTGADTGALHCTMVREEVTDAGEFLYFSPFDEPGIEMMAEEFTIKVVRSSNGETQRRYFIQTTITLQGKDYPITLSLANRSEMKWPMLIGKSFLQENGFLVDVNKVAPVS